MHWDPVHAIACSTSLYLGFHEAPWSFRNWMHTGMDECTWGISLGGNHNSPELQAGGEPRPQGQRTLCQHATPRCSHRLGTVSGPVFRHFRVNRALCLLCQTASYKHWFWITPQDLLYSWMGHLVAPWLHRKYFLWVIKNSFSKDRAIFFSQKTEEVQLPLAKFKVE